MAREPRSFRVEAIVLKHSDYGEADRFLTLYSRERGKLRAIAKGARKTKSRKAGHLEPFTRASIQLATGRDLFIVSQAEAQVNHMKLREDLALVGYASYCMELLDRFTYEDEENRGVYRLAIDTLERLNRGDDAELAVRYFEMHLLDKLGFKPELKKCVLSGAQIQAEDQYFSARLGGVVSPQHGKGLEGAVPVSVEALKYMRHFQRSTYLEAQRAKPAPSVQRELELLMQHYITYLLERGLNSPAFLRRVRRENLEK